MRVQSQKLFTFQMYCFVHLFGRNLDSLKLQYSLLLTSPKRPHHLNPTGPNCCWGAIYFGIEYTISEKKTDNVLSENEETVISSKKERRVVVLFEPFLSNSPTQSFCLIGENAKMLPRRVQSVL
jgi:hypothetical protein